jgi:hypothetical protein
VVRACVEGRRREGGVVEGVEMVGVGLSRARCLYVAGDPLRSASELEHSPLPNPPPRELSHQVGLGPTPPSSFNPQVFPFSWFL